MLRKLPIRQKLTLILVSVSIGVLLVACSAFVVFDRVSTMQNKQSTLTILCQTMAQTLAGPVAFGDADSTRTVLAPLDAEPTLVWGAVYALDGELLQSWRPKARDTYIPGRVDKLPDPALINDLLLSTPILAPTGAEIGTLVVRFSTEDVTQRTWVFFQIALAIMVLSTIIVVIVANQARKAITRPVEALAGAAGRVKAGDYDVRVPPLGQDELGQLGTTFNAMLDGIAERDSELKRHQEHLEALVAERTADLDRRNQAMRMVLDNVQQGLVTIDADGRLSTERSAAFDTFFGHPGPDTSLSELLERQIEGAGERFEVAWETLAEDLMPRSITLGQLPHDFELGSRYLTASYLDLAADGPFGGVLAVISDVTEQREQERSVRRQGEIIRSFQAMRSDPRGYEAFFDDAERIVGQLGGSTLHDHKLLHRLVHTLKGNSGLYGLVDLPARCHVLETALSEGRDPDPEVVRSVVEAWTAYKGRMEPFWDEVALKLGEEHVAELDTIALDVPRLARLLADLRAEPVRTRLESLARRSEALASRRGRVVRTEIDDGGLHVGGDRLEPLWQVLVHAIRNAVDHGIDTPEARVVLGKPPVATLRFSARKGSLRGLRRAGWCVRGEPMDGGPAISIDIEDDGGGIDFDRVRALAAERGLVAGSEQECIDVLFGDGFSTRDEVTETSGRGVGTSAVLEVVRDLGGYIEIESERGVGTRFTVCVPLTTGAPQPGQVLQPVS